MPVNVSYLFPFLQHNQDKVIAKEADDKGSAVTGWRFVFTLDNKKYVLHVENDDTVTATKVSYEFDFVSCIALSGHYRSINCTETR